MKLMVWSDNDEFGDKKIQQTQMSIIWCTPNSKTFANTKIQELKLSF